MKVLITGGTGLIGQAFINEYKHTSSYQFIVLSRQPSKAQRVLGNDVEIISTLENIDFNTIDTIVNLAGEPIADKRWTATQKDKICQSRWQLTKQLVEKIQVATNPPHTFISGSAIGYYGRQSDDEITEDFNNIYPEFTHTVCQQWEKIALNAHSDNTRVCLLRTGIVLDKNKGALKKMLPVFKLGLGGPIGNGKQFMSWIHIADMVKIIQEMINNPCLHGPINATAPHPVNNNEFSHRLSNVLGRPCIFRVPEFILKFGLGEMASLVIHGQNVVPQRLQSIGFNFEYEYIEKALENLLA